MSNDICPPNRAMGNVILPGHNNRHSITSQVSQNEEALLAEIQRVSTVFKTLLTTPPPFYYIIASHVFLMHSPQINM